MDPAELLTVFTTTETRRVAKHGVSVDGRRWNCPELDGYFGRTVTVRIPVHGIGFNELWIGDEHGAPVGIAMPDQVRNFTDTRQAQHSADRKKASTAAARAMQRCTQPKRDVGADITALGASMAPMAEPNLPAGVVSIVQAGGRRAIMPEQACSREQEQAERRELMQAQLAGLAAASAGKRAGNAN